MGWHCNIYREFLPAQKTQKTKVLYLQLKREPGAPEEPFIVKIKSPQPLSTPWSTLVELLRWRARHQPDRLAYVYLIDGETEGTRVTYAELDTRARAIAARLQAEGSAGGPALMIYQQGLEFIHAFYGCLYAGVMAVPVNSPHPALMKHSLPRLKAVMNDAAPTAIMTTTALLPVVEELLGGGADIQRFASDEVSGALARGWQEPELGPDSLALLQYTSGSTATPRGVMVSHGNFMHNNLMLQSGLGTSERSVGVGWLPFHHDMGLSTLIIHPLFLGFPSYIMSPVAFIQKPARWLDAISKYRATFTGSPSFGYDLCVQRISPEEKADIDLGSLKVTMNGADFVRHAVLEQFTRCFAPCGFRKEMFYACYGLAEATLIVSGGASGGAPMIRDIQRKALERGRAVAARSSEESRTLVGCGKTLLDQKLLIVDPRSRRPCPPDQVGEIWVSSASVAQGYWRRPEDSERAFQARLAGTGEGPFLRTGDLGFLDDGELFITGRIKDIIIIRGSNYSPEDLELTAEQCHAALRRGGCAAFGVEVDNEERLVIVAEIDKSFLRQRRRGATTAGTVEIQMAIRRAVSESHQLQVHDAVLIRAGGLPKTTSGKTQRGVCRTRYLTQELDVLDLS